MESQRDRLRRHFAEYLLGRQPASVLDVGCGRGELVDALDRQGVRAVGVDPAPAPGEPRAVVVGHATALPFSNGAFEWVSLRHVPHHLEHLRDALAEAWRVARRGLLLAEPWFDETSSEQRFALRADRWLKARDRSRGHYHAEALSADELQAALPAGARIDEVETFRPERVWTAEELGAEAQRSADGIVLERETERELANLLEVARRGRMTRNGTLIVTVPRNLEA